LADAKALILATQHPRGPVTRR